MPKDNVIEVNTRKGKIIAMVDQDPDYPGIWITIEGHDAHALVELLPDDDLHHPGKFVTRVWGADCYGDPVFVQEFKPCECCGHEEDDANAQPMARAE